MEHLTNSMSTRYIGLFPKDMDDIIEVLRLADRELLIVTDFIDYGSYSKPKTHKLLYDELKKAREKGVIVQCLVYGDKPAEETLLSQFQEPEFQKTSASTAFRQYFEYWSGIPHDTLNGFTHAKFLEILRNNQKRFETDLLDQGVRIQTLDQKVWLFFWMQDRQDAVFSFEDIGAGGQGLAFHTRDAKLVETFGAIFDRLSKAAPFLRQADTLLGAQTTSQANTAARSVIRFSSNPLAEGWKIVQGDASSFGFSQPTDSPGGLTVAADASQAMDYAVAEDQKNCRRMRFRVKLPHNAQIYAKMQLGASTQSPTKVGWVACNLGDRPPQKVSNEESVIFRPALADGWTLFDFSLSDEVAKSHFGKEQGLHFGALLGIRLRGSVTLSPIELILE
jgi:hypothetical protein